MPPSRTGGYHGQWLESPFIRTERTSSLLPTGDEGESDVSMRNLGVALAVFSLLLVGVPNAVAAPPAKERVIVVLQASPESVEEQARGLAQAFGGTIGFVYRTALRGFTLELPAAAVEGLRHNPQVAWIEPDVEVAITQTGGQPIPTGVDRVDADLNPAASPLDVDIAIIDTGVFIGQTSTGQSRSHLDLNLRFVTDCTAAIFYPVFGGCSGEGNHQDENGHGTHVAGIAAALDNDIGSLGTAPGATLWSVKVLNADGTGYLGSILAGIDFVASQSGLIEVANMSLGFVGTSAALDTSITNAVNAGVVFVAAAGNDAIDASQFSPAAHPDVITVSALADFDGLPGALGQPTCYPDVDDTLADFSNHGPLIEIAAPGVCTFSTHLNDGYATYSGTSMAAPFVTGAVARYIAQSGLSTANRADVMAIRAAVIAAGTPQTSACGFTGDPDSSREPLLFLNGSLFGGSGTCGGGSPPSNVAPVAAFSSSCAGLTCSFTNSSSDANGDPLTFAWNFGDGFTSAETNPSHVYVSAGSYQVSLTASDGSLSHTTSNSVTVSEPPANQPPEASFTSSCIDLACTFTNNSIDPDGDPLTYQWDFGDGSALSSAVNPTHTYPVEGSYIVSLTASDGLTTDTATAGVTVSTPVQVMTAGVYPILGSGRTWSITIDVFDADGAGVGDATVSGAWTYLDRRGRTRTVAQSGVTDTSGTVTLTYTFPKNSTVQSYCVSNLTKTGWVYQAPPITCGYPLT